MMYCSPHKKSDRLKIDKNPIFITLKGGDNVKKLQ